MVMNDFALAVMCALACTLYLGYVYDNYRQRWLRKKQEKLDAKDNDMHNLRTCLSDLIWVRNEMENLSLRRDDDHDLRNHLQDTLTDIHQHIHQHIQLIENESNY